MPSRAIHLDSPTARLMPQLETLQDLHTHAYFTDLLHSAALARGILFTQSTSEGGSLLTRAIAQSFYVLLSSEIPSFYRAQGTLLNFQGQQVLPTSIRRCQSFQGSYERRASSQIIWPLSSPSSLLLQPLQHAADATLNGSNRSCQSIGHLAWKPELLSSDHSCGLGAGGVVSHRLVASFWVDQLIEASLAARTHEEEEGAHAKHG